MQTFVILRRNGWPSGSSSRPRRARLESHVGDDEMSDDIRSIRSYVLAETDGSLGTVCIYQASSAEKVREHAQRAGLPADEVIPVADTVIVPAGPRARGSA